MEIIANHYTSYEVSKALWEAEIKFPEPAYYWYVPPPSGMEAQSLSTQAARRAASATIRSAEFYNKFKSERREFYPAYTAGELLREFARANHPMDMHVRHDDFYKVTAWRDRSRMSMMKFVADKTPEDALGLALIEIRRQNND